MDLRRLRYFVAVAETLHFGRAAKRLGIAQQPLSAQIQRLERDLGHDVFVRGANRVSLTAAGEVLLEESRLILAQVTRAEERTRRTARGENRSLSIGSCAAAMHHIVPTAVRAWKETYPDVTVQLREMGWSSQQSALIDGQIDVGFTYRPENEDGFEIETIAEDGFVVALPASDALSQARVLRPPDLQDRPFVAMRRDLNACAGPTLQIFRDHAARPDVAYEVSDRGSALGLVGNGLGFTVLPELAALPFPNVAYVPLETDRRMYLGVICASGSGRAIVHEQFIGTVRTLIEGDAFALGKPQIDMPLRRFRSFGESGRSGARLDDGAVT